MMVFAFGTAAGALIIGYFSDRIVHSKRALALNCIVRAILFASLAPSFFGASWHIYGDILLFILGFAGGGVVPQLLQVMRIVYRAEAIGTGSSLNATVGGLITAIFQPLFGKLISSYGDNMAGQSSHTYPVQAYSMLVIILALFALVGLFGVCMLGSYGKNDSTSNLSKTL